MSTKAARLSQRALTHEQQMRAKAQAKKDKETMSLLDKLPKRHKKKDDLEIRWDANGLMAASKPLTPPTAAAYSKTLASLSSGLSSSTTFSGPFTTFGTSTSGSLTSFGSAVFGGYATIEEERKAAGPWPTGVPSDDQTRFMVEQRIIDAICDCLRSDHYPQGIALNAMGYSSLKGSPLMRMAYEYGVGPFDGTDGPTNARFMGIVVHVVDVDDPLFVEVGW